MFTNCSLIIRSTSSLTVEDLEKKPKKAVQIITPLVNLCVKYGEPLEMSMEGETTHIYPMAF
jgi:hypothetical protein